jgi:hypothetical protein
MNVIVPIAGPDFVDENGVVKGALEFRGKPLLTGALESRPWHAQVPPSNYCFVAHDNPHTRAYVQDCISPAFPGSKVVFLSSFTGGAALSALAGLSLVSDPGQPLIIDLADILFDFDLPAQAIFNDKNVGGAALIFPSDKPQYSYLTLTDDGRMIEAREKQVISNWASAGVYMFRDAAIFLKSIAHSLENAETLTYRGLFFVCPLLNGVVSEGYDVLSFNVENVCDIKGDPPS